MQYFCYSVKGHDFGETGNLYRLLVVVSSDDLPSWMLDNDEAFRSNRSQVLLAYVKQLLALEALDRLH